MSNSTGVHQLDDDLAATLVHGVGDLAPPLHLGLAVDTGCIQVALAYGAGLAALGDDQPGGRALRVVLDVEVGGGHALSGAVAGQRGHHEALG